MSTIYLRGKNYYYETKIDGTKKKISLKTSDKKIAKKIQRELDIKIMDPKFRTKLRYSLGEIIEMYLVNKKSLIKPNTYDRYEILALNILRKLSINDITEIHSGHIDSYVRARKIEDVAPKTIREELRFLRSCINHAYDNRFINELPIRKWPKLKVIPKEPDKIGYYTNEEIAKMKEYIRGRYTHFYPTFLALIYTGVRYGELTTITPQDIDFEQNIVRIKNHKTANSAMNMYRYIEIHQELKGYIKNLIKEDPFSPIFKVNNENARNILKKTCKDLGIQYKRLHGTRHTFISNMLCNGVPLRLVMEMAGHTNPQTTMRYSHISQNDLKGKISSLGY